MTEWEFNFQHTKAQTMHKWLNLAKIQPLIWTEVSSVYRKILELWTFIFLAYGLSEIWSRKGQKTWEDAGSVAWYNGLPGSEKINPKKVIGQRNVVIDVARILLKPCLRL